MQAVQPISTARTWVPTLDLAPDELIVDSFAGGGGASTGVEQATGRHIDIAINHDPEAVAMHTANHPLTQHFCENVWKVDIAAVIAGRRVGLAWFSPDCKHFSKAKGGKPVSRKIRGLAWVALKWAGLVRPRVIILENVEEFETWSRLKNGRPDPKYKGETFKRWVRQLRKLGYAVEWRQLRACNYGAPTSRNRLFVVARCDGKAICWPDETHAREGDLFLQPFRTAADCIDWSLPCPSIFLSPEEGRALRVKRPLADATMRRIARGLKRYVLDAAKPFTVPIAHYDGTDRTLPIDAPLPTITAYPKGGSHALVVPTLVQTGYGEREGQAPRVPGLDKPLGTVVAGGTKHAVVAAFLAKHFGGHETPGADPAAPISTITAQDHHALVTSHLVKLRGTCRDGQAITDPAATISAQGTHLAEVRAFLVKYYGTDQDPRLNEPMHTLTTKHRLGVVTVKSEDYVIVDIGMRMLTPRELFRAQGFPEGYVIDHGRDPLTGRLIPLSNKAQVRMCGNSVSPYPAEALVRAQFEHRTRAAAA
jgi:DNA (cytosine-5)-methyltransferase 1